MMVAILNSAILDFFHLGFILLSFPLRLFTLAKIGSHICTEKLHLFILTHFYDGSHLELCHLGFRHLVIFSQIHSKHSSSAQTLTQANSIWLTWWWQPSWILLSWIQPSLFFFSNSSTLAKIGSHHLHKKTLNPFILTQLDDGSHLEFCWVGFRHNVFFSEIHSKPLSLSPVWL